MDWHRGFVTQEQIEAEARVVELETEVEHLRAVTKNWLGELKRYEALLIKEAKRTAGGRPIEADREEESAERADRREAERWRKDPHLAQLRKWSEVAWSVIEKAKREGWW